MTVKVLVEDKSPVPGGSGQAGVVKLETLHDLSDLLGISNRPLQSIRLKHDSQLVFVPSSQTTSLSS